MEASMDKDRNKDFIQGEPGMSPAAIILLVIAIVAVTAILAYVFIQHGQALSLPKVPK
jgi:hypothetical protein